jgi:solute carrier family 25 phosphate transporter 23/24/25/41
MFDAFRSTWQEEGIRAFYKGLLPSLCKVVPSASITYLAYEEMKKYLSI